MEREKKEAWEGGKEGCKEKKERWYFVSRPTNHSKEAPLILTNFPVTGFFLRTRTWKLLTVFHS